MIFFYPDEMPWGNEWIIRISETPYANDPDFYFRSSYGVVCARLLGFTFPDFLRYCGAQGATLKCREGYSYAIWKNKEDCQRVCNLINNEVNRMGLE